MNFNILAFEFSKKSTMSTEDRYLEERKKEMQKPRDWQEEEDNKMFETKEMLDMVSAVVKGLEKKLLTPEEIWQRKKEIIIDRVTNYINTSFASANLINEFAINSNLKIQTLPDKMANDLLFNTLTSIGYSVRFTEEERGGVTLHYLTLELPK